MRTPFIAANWKMNLDRAAIADFCRALRAFAGDPARPLARLGVFPPSVYLAQVVEALAGSSVAVGAQTCHPARDGAFTGEVSARMLRDVGASHVLAGHSERRQLFGETDSGARARLDAALAAGLDVIACLGETLAERRAGRTLEVVDRQLDALVQGLPAETLAARVTLAYEPVWAIGTGVTATPAEAQAVHAHLRARLARLAGEPVARRVLVQYGGSVKPDNVSELLACPDVDGALVGGASLHFKSFEALARLGRAAASGSTR